MQYDELLEMVKVKDKSKASNSNKQKFCDGWLNYALENGLKSETIDLICSGFTYKGMTPFVMFLKKTGDCQNSVLTLTRSAVFQKNRPIQFKMSLNLLALLLTEMRDQYGAAAGLMRLLPSISKTKEKTPLNDIGKSFNQYFYQVLGSAGSLTPLASFSLSAADLKAFVELLRTGLSQSETIDMGDIQKNGRNLVAAWISAGADTTASAAEPERETAAPKVNFSDVATNPVKNEPVSAASTNSGAVTSRFDMALTMLKSAYSKEKEIQLAAVRDLDSTRAELETSKKKQDELTARLEEYQKYIEGLHSVIAGLEKEKAAAALEMKQLRTDLQAKDQEIADRKQLSEIVRKDNEKQNDQFIQRMTGGLKSYYEDICMAREEPRSPELCQILIDEVSDMFDVLKSLGVTFD